MRRAFRLSATCGLALLLALPAVGLTASPGQLRAKISKKRQKESVLTTDISGYNVRIGRLQGEIRGLQERQGRIQGRLDQGRAELLAVRAQLNTARDRLAQLRKDLEKAEAALAGRLVELYKADEPDMVTVVLEADGFADLLERTEFLERISDQDRFVVGRVRDLKVRAKRQTTQLAGLETRAQNVTEAIAARRNEVAASKGRLVRSRFELQGARDGRKTILSRVRKSRTRLEGDLAAMEGRVQGALRQAQGQGGPIRRGSGRLIWPVNGPVVSPFGPRWGRLHAGVDIAVPSGTPIRAADGGRVVLLGWTGGYGNYTCVQHTSSMSSCYAHQSSYATSQGATVRQGQVIGSVGCTGSCFGDHLHFEVRMGGSPVDPMGYL